MEKEKFFSLQFFRKRTVKDNLDIYIYIYIYIYVAKLYIYIQHKMVILYHINIFKFRLFLSIINWRANVQSGLIHKSVVKTGRVA